jgi:hypothetical protein
MALGKGWNKMVSIRFAEMKMAVEIGKCMHILQPLQWP